MKTMKILKGNTLRLNQDSSLNCLFRLDVSNIIGFGHLKRCLSLACELTKVGIYCDFLVNSDCYEYISSELKDKLNTFEVFLNDISATLNSQDVMLSEILQIKNSNNINSISKEYDFLVLDHYGLSNSFVSRVKFNFPNIKVIHFNDLNDKTLDVDFMISSLPLKQFNIRGDNKNSLIGPRYSIVDNEFILLAKESNVKKSVSNGISKIIICFGSMDLCNLSVEFMINEFCSRFEHVRVLLSSTSKALEGVMAKIRSMSLNNVECVVDGRVVDHMLWADIFIGSPGVMAWECSIMSLPSILIPIAVNQKNNAHIFSNNNCSIVLDRSDDIVNQCLSVIGSIKSAVYQSMVESNSNMIDGFGAGRIGFAMLMLRSKVSLRILTNHDMKTIFEWQIEPGNRVYSNNTSPPSLDEHVDWFSSLSQDEKNKFYIIMIGSIEVGFIRLTDYGDKKLVSILLKKSAQGLGVAKHVLRIIVDLHAGNLVAEIHEDNIASISVFKAVGFESHSPGFYFA